MGAKIGTFGDNSAINKIEDRDGEYIPDYDRLNSSAASFFDAGHQTTEEDGVKLSLIHTSTNDPWDIDTTKVDLGYQKSISSDDGGFKLKGNVHTDLEQFYGGGIEARGKLGTDLSAVYSDQILVDLNGDILNSFEAGLEYKIYEENGLNVDAIGGFQKIDGLKGETLYTNTGIKIEKEDSFLNINYKKEQDSQFHRKDNSMITFQLGKKF